jgi:hypothetical protein
LRGKKYICTQLKIEILKKESDNSSTIRYRKTLMTCDYDFCHYDPWTELVYVWQNKKNGMIDLQNQVLVPVEFDHVGVCDNSKRNLFIIWKGGKTGIYDLCSNYLWFD